MALDQVELKVQPYDIVSSDRDGSCSVRFWTHDRESQRVLIRVEDFNPFCRLELPTFVDGRYIKWDTDSLKVYAEWIRAVMDEHVPTRIVYSELKRIYMYRPDNSRSPFLTCHFRSEEALSHFTRLINKQPYLINQLGTIKARVWETSIQTVHRLMTEIKVGYGQWLGIKAEEVPEMDRITSGSGTREYIASYKNIRPLPEEEVSGWITSPLAAAVDIECYSTNHKAMPNKLYIQDCVFMISYVTQRLGNPDTKKKYLLVLGDCPDIEGSTIIRYKHEIEMIDGLADLIKETDPSLIVGYNTYKFDYPYLDARVKMYLRDWKNCGLITDQKTFINTKTWKSSAYGFMNISTLEAEGRLSIDMFPIIKRDHKLDRYTLDFVSKHFLDRGKHDVSAKEMFRIYKAYMDYSEKVKQTSDDPGLLDEYQQVMKDLKKMGEYNLEDSTLCIDLMDKLKTWIALIETATVVAVTVMSIFTRGQQVRVQNQVYQYAYREGFVLDERAGNPGKFMGAFVVEPIPGKYKNILIFDFASLYPNIIRAFNICYTTLVSDDMNIPDEMCHILAWEETDDKGVVTQHRYRFIKQEHFSGILPRMCENLITARKAVRSKIGPQNDDVTNIVLDQRQGALKISANSIFGSLGVREGRMPLPEGAASITAMGRYLSGKAGDHVKEKHKGDVVYGDTDSIMVDLGIKDPHDCKTIGESLSEELSNLFPKPLKLEFERALAMALFIKKKKYAGVMMATIEKNDNPKRGPLVVVDSVEKVDFHPKYQNDTLYLWKLVYQETIHGKTDRKIEYIGVPRDVSLTIDQDYFSGIPLIEEIIKDDKGKVVEKRLGAPHQKKILKKGVVLARRDNCIWLKEVYLKVILNILFDKSMEETMDIINTEVLRMMSRSVPFLKMSITREIGSNYKPNSSYPLKIFSDELKRMQHPIQGGDRIDYVFVRSSDPSRNEKQGYKMRLHEHFWQNYQNEPLDCLHYVEKILQNPIEQILYLGYKAEIDAIKERCTPEIRRRGKIYTYISDKYVKTWVQLFKLKEDITTIIKTYRPHYQSQEPYFSSQFKQVTLQIIE